jgi:lactate dehydrogenase-like 2-hydroxyacid dehydrogenase
MPIVGERESVDSNETWMVAVGNLLGKKVRNEKIVVCGAQQVGRFNMKRFDSFSHVPL